MRARRRVPHVPPDPADHDAAPHVHVAAEHVPARPRPPEGRDAGDAEPHRDRARDVRGEHGRGLHLEAAARHRRLHDVRAVHVGLPRARDRASRSTRARSCSRPARSWRRRAHPSVPPPIGIDHEITIGADVALRAHHPGGDLVVHVVQGVRRDLPGEHRDPRQDPRHAALPVADGVELPGRARQRVPVDGEPEQPVGHEPG